jgi:Ca2+-binding EF-hand superfamily protein
VPNPNRSFFSHAPVCPQVRDALNREAEQKGQTLLQVFLGMDQSSDANLAPEELVAGLRKLKVRMTDEQEEELVRFADKDGDGEINFNEVNPTCVC